MISVEKNLFILDFPGSFERECNINNFFLLFEVHANVVLVENLMQELVTDPVAKL